MKQIIYIITFALGFLSCNNNASEHSEFDSKDSLGVNINANADIVHKNQPHVSYNEIGTEEFYKVYFYDSLFSNIELELKVISSIQFNEFEKKYKTDCTLDTSGFINGKGLFYSKYCKEICESYLTDRSAGVKLVLPSGYDAGVIGLIVAPSCNQFILYSSYDRQDYIKYYDSRAEIYGFTITWEQGFKSIKPSFKYFTKDWSIEQITWINNNTLALKLYNGDKNGSEENLEFSYFQSDVQSK